MPFLSGIFPPVPTPFDVRGEVDAQAMIKNLSWWNRFPLAGCVALGSNGEAELLDEEEKVRLVSVVRSALPADRMLIAGTGCAATRATIRLTRRVADQGADVALVLPPFYYKAQMTKPVLVEHFRAVADSSPIPIVVYNMPANTGLDLDADTVVEIARHDNVIGLKDSSGNLVKMATIRQRAPREFHLLAGSASFLLPAMTIGACGGILALANIAPLECLEIARLARTGDLEAARALQLRMVEPNTAVTRGGGVPALKGALDLIGLAGGPVRAPLRPLDEAGRDALREVLERAGILETTKEEQ